MAIDNFVSASITTLPTILPFRTLYLLETNCQIRYNACHERGWTDSWLLTIDGVNAGYGAVKGKEEITARDAVFEFYVLPAYRRQANLLFAELLKASGAAFIESQTNDFLTTSMLAPPPPTGWN